MKKIIKNPIYGRIITFLSLIFSSLAMLILIRVNQFGSLSKTLFIIFNVFMTLLVVLNISLVLLSYRKPRLKLRRFLLIFLVIASLGLGYLTVVLESVNASLKEITSETAKIEKHAVLVTKENNFIDELTDVRNKRVGIVDNDSFVEGNVMPRTLLEKEDISVRYTTYTSYREMLFALTNDSIDVASFPANYKQLLHTEETEEQLDQTKVIYSFSDIFDNVDDHDGNTADVTSTPFTLLLMGNDGGRTDSLMVASVNPNTMQVTLTSIARDSYVPIACYTNQASDKINHARTVSRECTIETVENLLDIKLDFFAEVNFQGLIDVVDALGGLEIDSPAAFAGNKWSDDNKTAVHIPKGVSLLDGDQVLAFVRERNSFVDGDFQRQRNQQQVISQFVNKVVEIRDPNRLLGVLKAAGNNMETNFSVRQMVDILNLAITRMDSSYIKNPTIFTFYGSRLMGDGQMIYTPDYGMELYYYIPYQGSIKEARDFINWNLRIDTKIEIPEGFNYDFKEDRKPPVFSSDYFDEPVNIIPQEPLPKPRPDEEVEEEQNEPLIYLGNFTGRSINEFQEFANSNGLILNVVNKSEVTNEIDKANTSSISWHSFIEKSVPKNTSIDVTVTNYVYEEENSSEPNDQSNQDKNLPDNSEEEKTDPSEEVGAND